MSGQPTSLESDWHSIDDMPRVLRSHACFMPPEKQSSVTFTLTPKDLLTIARRIEASAPRFVAVEVRKPLTRREAVVWSYVAASIVYMWLTEVFPVLAAVVRAVLK